jgi:hypothetical protein
MGFTYCCNLVSPGTLHVVTETKFFWTYLDSTFDKLTWSISAWSIT